MTGVPCLPGTGRSPPEVIMTLSADLDRGRTAYAEHRWSDALSALTQADQDGGLPAQDLEHASTAALLTGQETIGIDTATRAHEAFLASGDLASAARCAGWIGMYFLGTGDGARASGWLARAKRVLQANPEPCSVDGFLLIPAALGALYGGEAEGAARLFDEAFAAGERFHEPDLVALAQLGQGQAKIALGELSEGLSLFDEVMVAVTAGEVSPIPAGIIYCAVIGNCHLAFDLHRAQEWTMALDHWRAARPDMVMFSGQCEAHRAELYLLHGAWSDALEAARAAQARYRRGDRNAVYGAWYQQAEVQRLRGELDAAEESYRQASQGGYEPEPGLALLRLAQGKIKLAQAMIRRSGDTVDPATRRRLLPGLVEIELAAGDIAAARLAADELAAIASIAAMPMMQAMADQCEGAVLLEEGDARGALSKARRAWRLWQELDAPYEAARCRVLAALACRALGDEDSALMELETARAVFVELGAAPALAETYASPLAEVTGPLTPRELEVLRLVAAGKTNRVVAAELYISEKTVARHLSNMFTKLGLSSRAAATAYAYEHGMV
ncbi:MAG TPA: LuxR C-terminal-related transcriptional regulator [Homoserinimonas sp.]|nr:LuxR C-terminal-related transcriptional regulator [Homoserinimonas sp.]